MPHRFLIRIASLVLLLATSVVGAPATAGAQDLPAPPAGGPGPPPVVVDRVAGGDRIATAVAVSRQWWPEGSGTVLVGRSDHWADAVTGAPLAAALGAPILLTASDALDGRVAEELRRLGARDVIVLGGTAAVAPGVEQQLRGTGLAVRRVAGDSRFATAAMIAQAHRELVGPVDRVLLSSGGEWTDTLLAAAHGARHRVPVLLTAAEDLPVTTADALHHLPGAAVTVVGDVTAVDDAVLSRLRSAGHAVDRVPGSTPDAVAVALEDRASAPATSSILVSATAWPDALVAAAAGARAEAALLPVDAAHLHATGHTAAHVTGTGGHVTLIGGEAVITPTVAAALTGSQVRQATAAADAWSDPATWGGQVPAAGGTVTIPAGRTVRLDVSPPPLRGIRVEGTLLVDDTGPLALQTGWIEVLGRLQVGTEAVRHRNPLTITLDGAATDVLPVAGARALSVAGGTLELHGTAEPTRFTNLSAIAAAGSTQLHVDGTAGWAVGDLIAIASTDHDPGHAERRTITDLTATSVTVDRPLEHTHWGAAHTIAGHRIAERAEVGLLTRNVVIQGPEGETRFGGHVLAHTGATMHIEDVEVRRMGQTGVLARYPIHWHMMGQTSGNYVRSSAIHDTFNRCVTVHGTHGVTVADNVADDSVGHCYFLEDGVETGNSFLCNLGLTTRTPEPEDRIIESDATPATFWLSHPTNRLIDNVAAGSEGSGFWFDLPSEPTGASTGVELDPRRAPFGAFEGNLAHTNRGSAFRSGSGLQLEDYRGEAAARIDGFRTYRNRGTGVWAEFNATVTGATVASSGIGLLGRSEGTPGTVTMTGGAVVGSTPNAVGGLYRQVGIGAYHESAVASDITLANLQPGDFAAHATPVGPIALTTTGIVQTARLRQVNTAPTSMVLPWWEGPVSLAIADTDGTLTGAPQLVTGDSPLLQDERCRVAEEFGGAVCPLTLAFTRLRVELDDQESPGSIVRTADGATVSDPEDVDFTVLQGGRYHVDVPTAGRLTVDASSQAPGTVHLAVPATAGAHVYRGWGRWAVPLSPAPSQSAVTVDTYWEDGSGRVHLLVENLEQSHTRIEVCAVEHCGSDIGTR